MEEGVSARELRTLRRRAGAVLREAGETRRGMLELQTARDEAASKRDAALDTIGEHERALRLIELSEEEAKGSFERGESTRTELRSVLAELAAQRVERESGISRAKEMLFASERDFRALDAEMDRASRTWERNRPKVEAAEQAATAAQEAAEASALATREREVRAAKEAERRGTHAARALARAAAVESSIAEQQTATAVATGRKVLQRARESHAEARPVEEAAGKAAKEERARRARALLALRDEQEAAEAASRAEAAQKRAKRRLLERKRAKEDEEMLQQGINPHIVRRRRYKEKVEARVEKERKEDVKAARLALAKRMVDEAEATSKRDAEFLRNQEAAKAATGLEQKIKEQMLAGAYVQSMTRGGSDVIDPTGRMTRIDPSAVTDLKPASFGTGLAAKRRPDIVQKEANRPEMKGVRPDPRHIPAQFRQSRK